MANDGSAFVRRTSVDNEGHDRTGAMTHRRFGMYVCTNETIDTPKWESICKVSREFCRRWTSLGVHGDVDAVVKVVGRRVVVHMYGSIMYTGCDIRSAYQDYCNWIASVSSYVSNFDRELG
jgi:hypothetical protein